MSSELTLDVLRLSVGDAGRELHCGRYLSIMGHVCRLWDKPVVIGCI